MKYRALLIALMLWSMPALADGLQSKTFKATGTSDSINLKNTGIAYHKLTWNVTGTVSACSVELDSSANGTTWTAGGVITAQACTTNGNSTVVNSVVNYVRINMATFTGTGSVSVTWNGYVNNPGGGGGGTIGGTLAGNNNVIVDPSANTVAESAFGYEASGNALCPNDPAIYAVHAGEGTSCHGPDELVVINADDSNSECFLNQANIGCQNFSMGLPSVGISRNGLILTDGSGNQLANLSPANLTLGFNADTGGSLTLNDATAGAATLSVSGNMLLSNGNAVIGTAFNVLNYGAVGDGSTDNATALAAVFTATNAVTSGIPTIYFPCQTGQQCQYNFSGSGVSPINPLIPSSIACDPGTTLDYTGSAHALDVGPTGLDATTYQNQPYTITGCRFIGGASATQGIFVNQYITWFDAHSNSFYNFPLAAGTSWPIYMDGFNWVTAIHDNHFLVDTNTAINGSVYVNGRDPDSQLRFLGNDVSCVNGVHGTVGCSTAGIGLYADGSASTVSNNEIQFFQPDVELGVNCAACRLLDNYHETTSTVPTVLIAAGNNLVDGIIIDNSYANMHGNAVAFLGMTGGDTVSNLTLAHLRIVNIASSTQPIVALNDVVGQTGNQAEDIHASTGTSNVAPWPYLHTSPGRNILPWNYIGQNSNGDGFHRADGALGVSWAALTGFVTALTISSDTAVCASGSGCGSLYAVDLPGNQRIGATFSTIPLATDYAVIYARDANYTVNPSSYACVLQIGTGVYIQKTFGGSQTVISSTVNPTFLAGAYFEIEAVGSVITCYVNGVPVVSASDSDVTAGWPAVAVSDTTAVLSSFTAKGLP